MVTPELISYIKGEFAKGKTREMIRATLAFEGGWSEVDINDAFRTVVPIQSDPIKINPTQSSPIESSSVHSSFQSPVITESSSSKISKFSLVVVIVALIVFVAWYFYRAPMMSFWNSLVSSLSTLPSTIKNIAVKPEATTPVVDNIVIPEPVAPAVVFKDCGTSASPDLKNSKTYRDNVVLNCLGNSALVCEDAKAVLTDALFPSIVEIVKDPSQNTCSFRLSYANDSTLVDANGNSLSGQYISCPINIVKAVDESKPSSPVFKAPTLTDVNKYASQIYFYGTLGVFMENNVDINKIQTLGCSGNYINSVIMSYQKTQ